MKTLSDRIAQAAARVRRELPQAINTSLGYAGALKAPNGTAPLLTAICGRLDRAEIYREALQQTKARTACKRRTLPPPSTLAERLTALRTRAITTAACSTLRSGDYLVIFLTANPEEVGATYHRECIGRYSSRCSYLQYEHTLRIIVPALWRTRVEQTGLATAGGMLTLDAQPCDCSAPGVRLYAARWVEQAAGYSCRIVDGYLAITESGETHHAKAPELALRGLARKRSLTPDRRREIAAKAQTGRLRNLAARNDFQVCLSDARAIGACEYGIRSWCHRAGIDPAVGCIPAAEAIAAYFANPVSEARAAILYAARRA